MSPGARPIRGIGYRLYHTGIQQAIQLPDAMVASLKLDNILS